MRKEPNVPDAPKNEYLEQVKQQQQRLEVDLKANRAMVQTAAGADAPAAARRSGGMLGTDVRVGPAVDVRITGFLWWKTVVVPPNAYIIHTRRGHNQPLHLGLGMSFGFNPWTDSFLVVPSTMQTILINAYCICKDLQGLLVQGYVQWIIADFATAYKKLDFSDTVDPMRLVNIQLREQAEAAIKDKVATMGIDDVLSDKQPIMEELIARLRAVAEGQGNAENGLGLRIVTVQIKEAVVSSTRLWENLQKPFRSERARIARLAELKAESEIQARELEHKKAATTAEIQVESELAHLRAEKESEAFAREQAENARRHKIEAEAQVERSKQDEIVAHANAVLERVKATEAAELARLRQQEELARKDTATRAELALEAERLTAANRQTEVQLTHEQRRQQIRNEVSPAQVQAELVRMLPEVARQLPKPTELKSISIGGAGGAQEGQALASLVAQVVAIADAFRSRPTPGKDQPAG